MLAKREYFFLYKENKCLYNRNINKGTNVLYRGGQYDECKKIRFIDGHFVDWNVYRVTRFKGYRSHLCAACHLVAFDMGRQILPDLSKKRILSK
ncbi:MAG TPA: hypothetical protein DIC43_02930 [Vagococcus sp.]|nr:hypothetical protein [Vagococcus sp.]